MLKKKSSVNKPSGDIVIVSLAVTYKLGLPTWQLFVYDVLHKKKLPTLEELPAHS